MPKNKSWEISKLSSKQDFTASAKVILHQRLNEVIWTINLYFNKISSENLHQIRIALRRIRYPMEVFLKCFNRKKYLSFYKKISLLQDSTGELRDLDVFRQNFISSSNKYLSAKDEEVLMNIENRKEQLQKNLKLELMKMIHSKELKDFKKLIA